MNAVTTSAAFRATLEPPMGRMLDSLKQLNGQSKVGPESTPPAPPSQPKPAAPAVDETLDAEDLPFIEVGAPGKKVDGSPSVMASSPAAAKPLTPPPPPS